MQALVLDDQADHTIRATIVMRMQFSRRGYLRCAKLPIDSLILDHRMNGFTLQGQRYRDPVVAVRPLVAAGLLPADYPVSVNAVSGYTGGGKQLIAQIEDSSHDDAIGAAYFAYALTLAHKHVPEIMTHTGITRRPIFTPAVGRFAQGMLVNVPLHLDLMTGNPSMADVHAALEQHYAPGGEVSVVPLMESAGLARLDPEELVGTNQMKLYVCGTQGAGTVNLVASLDNLGKGASGAAVQNLDLMIGA